MKRKEILAQLRVAKSAHIQWRSYAQAITAGIPVENDHVPVLHTNCKFGKWYYGQGQQLASLSSYGGIDTPHEVLHQIYKEIYNILFGENNQSKLSKFFGLKRKVSRKEKARVDELMQNLLGVSGTLLEAINVLEKEIQDVSDAELQQIY